MKHFACQVTIRLVDNRVLTPSPAQRRVMAEAILRIARDFPLLVFRIADTHIHLVVMGSLALAAELARRIEISMQRLFEPGVPSVRAWVKPIDGQKHLTSLFRYVLVQDDKHLTEVDPLHDGSNLPDLLGMRLVGRFTARMVREHLPRVRRGMLCELLGVDGLEPAAGPASLLREAAQSAAALGTLSGRGAAKVLTRIAAVHAARPEATAGEVAAVLKISRSTVDRLAKREADQQLVRAIRVQMDARRRLARAALRASGAALYDPSLAEAPMVVRDGA